MLQLSGQSDHLCCFFYKKTAIDKCTQHCALLSCGQKRAQQSKSLGASPFSSFKRICLRNPCLRQLKFQRRDKQDRIIVFLASYILDEKCCKWKKIFLQMLDEMILKNCRRRPSNLKDDHEAEALNWDVIPIL